MKALLLPLALLVSMASSGQATYTPLNEPHPVSDHRQMIVTEDEIDSLSLRIDSLRDLLKALEWARQRDVEYNVDLFNLFVGKLETLEKVILKQDTITALLMKDIDGLHKINEFNVKMSNALYRRQEDRIDSLVRALEDLNRWQPFTPWDFDPGYGPAHIMPVQDVDPHGRIMFPNGGSGQTVPFTPILNLGDSVLIYLHPGNIPSRSPAGKQRRKK